MTEPTRIFLHRLLDHRDTSGSAGDPARRGHTWDPRQVTKGGQEAGVEMLEDHH